MLTVANALLADIIAHPEDDALRLILADWLDEHDEPERAEFIRLQCELARPYTVNAGEYMVADDQGRIVPERFGLLLRRERELLLSHGSYWALPVASALCCYDWEYYGGFNGDEGKSWTFRRGFVAEVTCSCGNWLAHGPAVVRAHPVERVKLSVRLATSSFVGLAGQAPTISDFYFIALSSSDQVDNFPFVPRGTFSTRQEAWDTLSADALTWARNVAEIEKLARKVDIDVPGSVVNKTFL